MERKYIASFDNGHEFFTIEFMSGSRAGSLKNKEDAVAKLRAKKGNKVARCSELINVNRYEYRQKIGGKKNENGSITV